MNVLKEDFSKQKRLLNKKKKGFLKNYEKYDGAFCSLPVMMVNSKESNYKRSIEIKENVIDVAGRENYNSDILLPNIDCPVKTKISSRFNLEEGKLMDIQSVPVHYNFHDPLNCSETSISYGNIENMLHKRNKLGSVKLRTPKINRKGGTSEGSTMLSDSSKISSTGGYILAVTEGRGHARGEVGLASMDPARPHLILIQISDDHNYLNSLTKINVLDPSEIVVPNSFINCGNSSKLYFDIRARFPTVPITNVPRRHFSEALGVDLIKLYCSSNVGSLMVLLRDKFYALSATAALIKYMEFTLHLQILPHSLKIEYQGIDNICLIDLDSANRLELIRSFGNSQGNFNTSLFRVMNHCHTKGGSRLLRANLLQPSCDLGKIMNRLDCIAELVNNPILFCTLEGAVSCFSNIESLLYLCLNAPQQNGLRVAEFQLKYTLLLKTILEDLPTLSRSLQHASAAYFRQVFNSLKDSRFSLIHKRILETIMENTKTLKSSAAGHLHGCFAIKAGINSLLDVAKKAYCEIIQEMTDHVTHLRAKYNMSLKISFSIKKGFHIQWALPLGEKKKELKDMPQEFILIEKHKKTFTFYTHYLVALDQRSHHILNEIKLMTNVIVFELLTDIRPNIGCLFDLCENIAELDLLLCFAQISLLRKYVRPSFGEELNLKESKHPVLDVSNEGKVVPNDVLAKCGKNFIILTGPNQSGKSIYIRQIALLQIMAQIGCYVPAKNAKFKLMSRIFSRIGFDDNLESNASTLIVEMTDIQYIYQNFTPNSLIIIDELCRGTSVEEGTNLAFSISENLLDSPAFIFFTTHYLFLTKLEEMYCNVANFHFETKLEVLEVDNTRIQFLHVLKPGITKADLYGLQVATLTSFPKDVCSKAGQISDKIIQNRKPVPTVNGLLASYQLSLELREELIKTDQKFADWESTETVIRRFKNIYLNLKSKKVQGQKNFDGPILTFSSRKLALNSPEPQCRSTELSNYGKPVKRKKFENFGKFSLNYFRKQMANKKNTIIILDFAKKIIKKYAKLKLKNNK